MIPLVSGRRELSSHPHAGNPTGPPGLADGKCFYLGSQQPKGGLEPWVAGGLAKDWPGPSSTHFGRGPTCFLSGLLLREGQVAYSLLQQRNQTQQPRLQAPRGSTTLLQPILRLTDEGGYNEVWEPSLRHARPLCPPP